MGLTVVPASKSRFPIANEAIIIVGSVSGDTDGVPNRLRMLLGTELLT